MKFNEVTNSDDLELILKNEYPRYDYHVVAMDQLETIKPKMKQIIIVNYQRTGQPGNHWLLVLIHQAKYIEFFDSFANEPPKEVLDFMRKAKRSKIVRNLIMTTVEVQTFENQYCGWADLYYVNLRINNDQAPYEAVNNMDRKSILQYGKSLWAKYLQNDH